MTERITRMSQEGFNLLKEVEGFRSKPYLDGAGVPTIGYGSTYYQDGSRVRMTDKAISESVASELLNDLVLHYERTVDCYMRDDITQHEFDALCVFAYNVGAPQFKTSTLIKKINAYAKPDEIKNQFLRWNKVAGKTDKGLINRRNKEIALFFKK